MELETRDLPNTETNSAKKFVDISTIAETQNSSIITLGRVKKIFVSKDLEKLVQDSPITKAELLSKLPSKE